MSKSIAIEQQEKQIDQAFADFEQHHQVIDKNLNSISSFIIDSSFENWPEQAIVELREAVAGIWMEALYVDEVADAHTRKHKAHTEQVVSGRCTTCHKEVREKVGNLFVRAGLKQNHTGQVSNGKSAACKEEAKELVGEMAAQIARLSQITSDGSSMAEARLVRSKAREMVERMATHIVQLSSSL